MPEHAQGEAPRHHVKLRLCREHNQFLEEVRAHVLHNGPKPGAGQMLSRATLASRSSGDLAGHDSTASVAAAREDSSASAAGPSASAEAPESKGVPCSHMQAAAAVYDRPVRAARSHVTCSVLWRCLKAQMRRCSSSSQRCV